MSDARQIEELNAAVHALLFRLNLARLDLWSSKLAGIGYLDLHAMSFAEEAPGHTLAEMRELLQVPQSTLTSIIDRLEKRGLVRRAVHPTDRRSYLIELTDAGRGVQDEHRRVERSLHAQDLGRARRPMRPGALRRALPNDREQNLRRRGRALAASARPNQRIS